ncbi:MAG TPA: NAD(P)/FAD-dependent oxidoreductase [Sporichthyaceae bacterium]|jgi:cation diffusion facilitator CzcD-associated flavoprotein CzcO
MSLFFRPSADSGLAEVDPDLPEHCTVVIVGTGFGGLGAGLRLARAGRGDFVLLERADDIGGVWRDNTYPGARCDVPSRLYSYSFRRPHSWTTTYAPQSEILDYLRRCAQDGGVWPHIRFGTELQGADWDAAHSMWRLRTNRGAMTANFLVLATGTLAEPVMPNIAGLDSFPGTVFHSARWNHSHDLVGRRVGVIGSGASAIQFIPQVQAAAAELVSFQRSPAWVVRQIKPRRVGPISRGLNRIPGWDRAMRALLHLTCETMWWKYNVHPKRSAAATEHARRHLKGSITDPGLQAQLTPDYRLGCKRLLISSTYYPALDAANARVVTTDIAAVEPAGVRTADGALHEVDTLILGTGFRATDHPVFSLVRGRDGRSLAQTWATEGHRAHLGTTVSGFPNLFVVQGPNAGSPHVSAVYMIEAQLNLIISGLTMFARKGIREFDVRPEVEAAWQQRLAASNENSVWISGCSSYYLDAAGRNAVLWPEPGWRFRRATKRFQPHDYHLTVGQPYYGDPRYREVENVPVPSAVGSERLAP